MYDALHRYPLLRKNHVDAMYLPNLVQKIISTCFSLSQRPSNRSNDPVGHILNKAWPMRCSVRNFSDIVSLYIQQHEEIFILMRRLLYSTMVGAYPNSAVRATVPLRIILYKYYVSAPISAEHFATWLKQGHYLLLFVAIKEYIAFTVSQLPGLLDVLKHHFSWNLFFESVTKHADLIRSTLNQFAASPHDMFERAMQVMSNVRSFKCPAPPLDIVHVSDHLQTTVRLLHQPVCDFFKKPIRMQLYNVMLPAVQAGVPLSELCKVFNLPESLSLSLGECSQASATLLHWRKLKSCSGLTDNQAIVVHELVQAWICCKQIAVHDLPLHVQQAQAEQTSGKDFIFACLCCRQLRAFVVDEGTTGNAWACGHQRVLLDDMTGQVFCGKRNDTHHTAVHRSEVETRRSYWKNQQGAMCSYCPLLKIHLRGKILSFFGKLFVLCPLCMCVMRLTDKRFSGGSINCVNCSYRTRTTPNNRCFHCYCESDSLVQIALQTKAVFVCSSCHRRWMKDDSITSNLTEEIAHQAINERWSVNRVTVYCVCS